MEQADDKPLKDETTQGETARGETTHFGFRDVAVEEKERLVRGVFDSVATKYDLMNDHIENTAA